MKKQDTICVYCRMLVPPDDGIRYTHSDGTDSRFITHVACHEKEMQRLEDVKRNRKVERDI